MKKVLIVSLLAVVAGSAFAQVFDMGGNLESRTISVTGISHRDTPTVVYSAISSPYAAFGAATGSLGFEDYNSISAAPFTLDSLRFVGGVTAVNGVVSIDFFDLSNNFVNGFTVALPAAGNFVWTIDTLAPLGIVLPQSGQMQITALDGVTGQWFLSTVAPTVGTQDPNIGSIASHSHRYELTAVPEPGTMAAIALGLAGIARRRKKA